MHVRFSTCRGTPLIADDTDAIAGNISGILIHPDVGRVEGFFIRGGASFLRGSGLYLPAADIAHWGTRVRVRSVDVLSPFEDHIRLQALLKEGRTVLGQRILTEGGRSLGRCADVQFETKTYRLEWMFPRKFFLWRPAIPVAAIIEVRPAAVIVRETLATEPDRGSVLQVIEGLAEAPVPPAPEPS